MTDPKLQRVTLNLKVKHQQALHRLIARSGDNQTDVISRAILLLDKLEELTDGGALLVQNSDGNWIELLLL